MSVGCELLFEQVSNGFWTSSTSYGTYKVTRGSQSNGKTGYFVRHVYSLYREDYCIHPCLPSLADCSDEAVLNYNSLRDFEKSIRKET